ncbi:MAG: DHHA1 domain-containing protein [Lysobacteraceae bacterium]
MSAESLLGAPIAETATPMQIVRRPPAPIGDWPDATPDVLRRVYAARGIASHADARLSLADLLPPESLGGMEKASALLASAIKADRRIVIVGDFDCDGATGTALGVRGLRMLGATQVAYQVPHRILHGYGLSPALVDAMRPLNPELLITVDNGIACHAGAAAARALGWQVLITDHHLPGATLPDADAIVNPNCVRIECCGHGAGVCEACARDAQLNDAFPSKAMAGVGVLFYLLLATRRVLRAEGWFQQARFQAGEPDLAILLDLVAIGTVADMVPLDANNRRLVAAGLQRIRRDQCQPGVHALADVAGRALDGFTSPDIGFGIGPRLNAAGRLEDMAIGIECLLADDAAHAQQLAQTLNAINAERRELQQTMIGDADALLDLSMDASAPAICVFDGSWHPGVIGLVASKLKERLHRPVVAFAPGTIDGQSGGGELRGSARSIDGYHVRDALVAIDAAHPGLITRFGGHAMAAGLSLPAEHLSRFMQAWIAQAAATLNPDSLQQLLHSDGELATDEIARHTAEGLRAAGPWGQGFPEPLFDGEFEVADWRQVGRGHLKMVLHMAGSDDTLGAIQFGGWTGRDKPLRVRLAYQLDLDDYPRRASSQRSGIQLLVRLLEVLDAPRAGD